MLIALLPNVLGMLAIRDINNWVIQELQFEDLAKTIGITNWDRCFLILLVGQICAKFSKCSLIKSTIFARCLAFEVLMVLDIEPAGKLIFSIENLSFIFSPIKIPMLTKS